MLHWAVFKKYKLQHAFFWMLLLGLWFMLRYEDYTSPAIAFQVTLLKVADLILLVYITNYVLIPRLLYKRKFIYFGLLFILMIVVSSLAKMHFIDQITGRLQSPDFSVSLKTRIYDNIIPHFFLVIAGAAIKLMFDQIGLQKKMADLAREKAEAELSFLKSQINPHFLFNSLNSVYFLIDKKNEEARRVLQKFSDMLRYQLYETNGQKIPIEKEISFLSDYMELQKLRKEAHYKIKFHCEPDVKGFSIEPLLLIPFLENAFKHISHKTDRENYVNLSLKKTNSVFEFSLENSKEMSAVKNHEAGGIGLANVRRRLELLYPGKHELEISENDTLYNVTLKLNI